MSPITGLATVCRSSDARNMSRTARASKGGVCYHAINRGNGRATVFHNSCDYEFFVHLMVLANRRIPMRLLAYCLMPNHFHLVLWPFNDGDLGRWMHWLLTSHVRRYHKLRGTSGRVWQGRFKAFPVQQDGHLLKVMRYVERNPLRASLVATGEDWPWSSLNPNVPVGLVVDGPVEKPKSWRSVVDRPMSDEELRALRNSCARNAPFGDGAWSNETASRLGLQASLRPLGRPRRLS